MFFILLLLNVLAQEVETLWENLCSKYRELRRQEKRGCASGSAAQSNPEDIWPFYKSMQFLNPYIEHNETLSSTQKLSDTGKGTQTSRFKRRKSEKDNSNLEDRILNITEKLVENNTVTTKNAQDTETEKKEQRIANFMPLIKRSLRKLSEEDQKECSLQIMCIAKQFQ